MTQTILRQAGRRRPWVGISLGSSSTPPTSYTQAFTPTSGTVPRSITLTYTLNHPATSNVTITPDIGGTLYGSFSPTTVTITTGNTVGTTTLTTSCEVTIFCNSTNNASLTNPGQITFSPTAIDNPGTITQTGASPTSLSFSSTEALNNPPYTHQWWYRVHNTGDYTSIGGATSLTLTQTGLSPGTTYDFALQYINSIPTYTVSTITATTTGIAPPPTVTRLVDNDIVGVLLNYPLPQVLPMVFQTAATATTYTQAIVPTSGSVPASATLTYTLNNPAPVGGVVITPSATHGTFSPTSVTIAQGQTVGTTTLSDSTVGVSTISSTNGQGLTNPANITFTAFSSTAVQMSSPNSVRVAQRRRPFIGVIPFGSVATTYSISIAPTSGNVPATATLTVMLNGVLPVSVTITPSATAGTFSPTTITIPAGQTLGTSTFTDNTVGVSTITATNNQSLTNPSGITFNATSGSTTPVQMASPNSVRIASRRRPFIGVIPWGTAVTATSYTQTIVPTSGNVPATAVLTYVLNGTLSVPVTITPSPTLGTFSPTSVTIAAGQTSGSTTLTDNTVGVSTISSTNNQSLSNPANVTFTGTASVTQPLFAYIQPTTDTLATLTAIGNLTRGTANIVPLPPAKVVGTTYSQAIVPTSGAIPATATLTYTLNGVLSTNVTITPSATIGTFSPSTVTITAGNLTGTTTLTDNVAGVSTISSTNNEGLTNPANITFTGTTTTTYTLSISPTSGQPPTTATLTITLTATLPTNVTITPASSTASFSPASVTITAGNLTGTTTVTLDYVGETTITATNNAGLTDSNPTYWFGTGGTSSGGGQGLINIIRPFTLGL